MPKKTLAAALAAVVLLPLLVFVDLPAAQAHEQTKTVRRCAYDPFAGRQCWNETVGITHRHRVIPDNPPPDTSPKPARCPAGTTGTPPDCSPVPPDNTNRVTPTTTAAPPPTTTTTEPPKCPAGYTGTPPDCEPPKCPPGQTGTPPNCKIPPPPCSWPKHSHGDTCHGPHGEPPCGTGPWRPHSGHDFVKRTPCKPEPCGGGGGGQGSSAYHDHDGRGCHADTPNHVHPCKFTKQVAGHSHTVGDSADAVCHSKSAHSRQGGGHCPGGHTEIGHHGSGNCKKNADYHKDCPGGYKWDAERELCYLDGAVKITQDVGRGWRPGFGVTAGGA
ncbi:MAG: hypothetical protein F4117_15120 [Acidimicrobiales bacterium]|nr:hypothetical protein [Acidimicrobiales bacterium]MYB81864.1 hypothetical protein [Acidimicrobiales bacterium]MYI13881.1 hypothetical protein [Acidimicrobiales bacterium]